VKTSNLQYSAFTLRHLFGGRFIRNDIQNLLEPRPVSLFLYLIELIIFSLDPSRTTLDSDSSEFPQFEFDIFKVCGVFLREVHIFSTEGRCFSVTAGSH
jgi:hypothetical protein